MYIMLQLDAKCTDQLNEALKDRLKMWPFISLIPRPLPDFILHKTGCGLGSRLTQILIPIGGIGAAWASTNFNVTQCKSQWTLYTNCKCWPKFSISMTFWKCWRWTWVSRMMINIFFQLNITVWLWLCEGPNSDSITAKLCAPFAPKHVKKHSHVES